MNVNSMQFKVALAGFLLTLSTSGYSVTLADRPLFVGQGTGPNVLFIIDDSGSMDYEFIPDDLRFLGAPRTCVRETGPWYRPTCAEYRPTNRYYYSVTANPMFFDPDGNYPLPKKADGSDFPQPSFTAAPWNGYQSGSVTYDLSTRFPINDDLQKTPTRTWSEAFYYKFDTSLAGCDISVDQRDSSCYVRVSVAAGDTSLKNKFARWYSYYRSRLMLSKAGTGRAFASAENLDEKHIGWGSINTNYERNQGNVDGVNVRAVKQGVRIFDTTHRNNFFNWLYGVETGGGTPLRLALEGTGEYYTNSDIPWQEQPGVSPSGTSLMECRPAFTILMTDGYYTDGVDKPEYLVNSYWNQDNSDGSEITSPLGTTYQYKASDPFKDNYNTTLGDIAMWYWKNDIRSDIPNLVPENSALENDAFWQHMSVLGVALGLAGGVDQVAAETALEQRNQTPPPAIAWPDPFNGSQAQQDRARLDDLLHAGINSRGGFFNAADPSTFSDQLSNALSSTDSTNGAASGLAVGGNVIESGKWVAAGSFNTFGWTGDLLASQFASTDLPDLRAEVEAGNGWSAADELDARDLATDPRNIITYNRTSARSVVFDWANLTTAQKDDLKNGGTDALGQSRLAFIKGDRSQETSTFRTRQSRLGSIVNSSPAYVGEFTLSNWPSTDGFGVAGDRLTNFRNRVSNRDGVFYVGANDGMLHGFRASDGKEVLAYIPDFVYSTASDAGLHYLTDRAYKHRYYVDLSLQLADVYTKGKNDGGDVSTSKAWRSVVIGGGRAGAKGIFALDVTNPADFTTLKAGKAALWEFTAADDARLGNIMTPPVVSLATWGGDTRWTVFVNNGYNSSTGSTGFFMLDFEGGLDGTWSSSDYQYVEFKSGGTGLSAMNVLDTSGDYLADRVYAGDLDGNVWVATNSSGSWASAYSQAAAPVALFKADAAITAAPIVGANTEVARTTANVPNLMVYVGTGQYLNLGDLTTSGRQYFYGVWDSGPLKIGMTKADLVERTFTSGTETIDGESFDVRTASGDTIVYGTNYGWYAQLPSGGERVVEQATIYGDYVYGTSIIPSADACLSGGDGWILAFDRMTGLVSTESMAFKKHGADIQGIRQSGMPFGARVVDGQLLFGTSKGDIDSVELDDLNPTPVNAGLRGWQEITE